MMILKKISSLKSVIIIAVALLSLSTSTRSHAEEVRAPFVPVTILYLIKDESALGYKEKLRWSIKTTEDWEHFYNTMISLPEDQSTNPDPLKAKVNDMIVLTRKDTNHLTGFDIYISHIGIMAVHRDAVHSYFPDSNKLWDFLKEEQEQNAAFETFSSASKISTKSPGIVATYNINQNIPNPVWLVDSPGKIASYDSYFLMLKPYTEFDLRFVTGPINFDIMGVFILNLNYPNAPADIASVTSRGIRLSKGVSNTKFYEDTEDYYNFYKSQAREMLDYNERFGDKLKSDAEREF